MGHAAPCRLLEWDTRFFGRRIGRVDRARLDAAAAEAVVAWCEQERIDCTYLLADPGHEETERLARAIGFRRVDERVTLRTRLAGRPAAPPGAGVRLARDSDRDPLAAVARVSHRDSRFYADSGFPRQSCDALYEVWLSQSFDAPSGAVLVVEDGGAAVGYVTCQVHESGQGEIGLLAVAEACRGKGLGGRLLAAALDWFVARRSADVVVVTQGRNLAALRAYRKAGFTLEMTRHWYHRWGRDPSAAEGLSPPSPKPETAPARR